MKAQKRNYDGRDRASYRLDRLKKVGDFVFIPYPDSCLTPEDRTRFSNNVRSSATARKKIYFNGDRVKVQVGISKGVTDVEDGLRGFNVFRMAARTK